MQKPIDFTQRPLKIFLAYIARQKRLFLIDTACAIAVAVIDLAFPFVSRRAMQQLLPAKLYTAFFTVMGLLIFA